MDAAPPADPTDDDLAARAAQRDRAAFDQLVDRHARPLAAWLLRRLARGDVEDVLQETLFKARRGAADYKGGNYRAWLFQVARSALVDRHFQGPVAPDHAAPVAACLTALDDHGREVVRARFGGAGEPSTSPDLPTPALGRFRACVQAARSGRPLVLPAMPDNPAELAGWLDRQVAGPDLARLVAELSAVHGPAAAPDLATTLGPDLPAVLAGGLGALSGDRLGVLLRNPRLLAELQDAVAEAASPYWDDLFNHPTLANLVRRAVEEPADLVPVRPSRRRYPRPPWYLQPWFVALATTVMILGTVLLHRTPRPSWGWNNARVVTRGETSAKRLTALADAAGEWRSRPRQTPAELRRALREMRDGSTAVLAADHRVLTPADRVWLLEKCVAWGTRLDRHLTDLQEGRSADQVRAEADETVEEMVRELREQAGGRPDE